MAIVLTRVDDRLIHGQVVIGWGRPLGIEFILLVDDQVAASPWEQDLYRMGVPDEIEVIFATVSEAAAAMPGWRQDSRRGIVLAASIETLTGLEAAGAGLGPVNLGGIHHRPGRVERLPYLYLTDDEVSALRHLAAGGVTVTAQDLPTASPVALESFA